MAPGTRQRVLLQLPILALVGMLFFLYVRLPYCYIDSDSATFGLMGEDIYHYRVPTTLTYGQNYLLSVTPYVYAAVKSVMPGTTDWGTLLAVAGGILSLSGLWMIYQSLMVVTEQTGRRRWLAGVLFCTMLLSQPKHIFDMALNSSTELALVSMGLMMWSASRVSWSLRRGEAVPCRWWGLLGLAFGYATFARPQVCAYGILPVVLLLRQQYRAPRERAFRGAVGWLSGGLFAGSFLMIYHWVFRASTWPFRMDLGSHAADLETMRQECTGLVHMVLPAMFSWGCNWGLSLLHNVVVVTWILAAVAGYLFFLLRRRDAITPIDHGWFWGPLIVLAVMLTHTNMVTDQSNRRYCLQGVESIIWLCSRFCIPAPPPREGAGKARPRGLLLLLGGGLALALLASAAQIWRDEFVFRRNRNTEFKCMRRELVPELARHDAVILANYWDAYILYFLGEGRLRIEATPWFWVRTYGRFSADEMRKKTLWFVRRGYGRSTAAQLARDVGGDVVERMESIPVEATFLNMPCELWRLPVDGAGVTIMERYHPLYFSTPYPPGSRR